MIRRAHAATALLAAAAVLVTTSGCSLRRHVLYVPTESMANTIRMGDRIDAKPGVRPVRGSIIVFRGPQSWQDSPNGNAEFLKRVIGIGGDHVVCCDAAGGISVNGHPLVEPYLYRDPLTKVTVKASETPFDVVVTPGRLWVMGDHRTESADSRSHRGDGESGTIPVSSVVGVVVSIVSPREHAGPLRSPSYAGL